MKTYSRTMFMVCAVLFGAFMMSVLFHANLLGRDAGPVIKVETTPVNRDASPVTSYASIVKKAAPSVVNIYTTRIVKVQTRRNPFANDPYFRQFFGNAFSGDGTRKEQVLGSGVVVSPDGYILTANHVVSGEDEIKVTLDDGSKKEYSAQVIGADPQTDIALLKIDARYLSAITLGDSDQVAVGDVVLAIGNPLEIGQTVTMGIVSALGRSGLNFGGSENPIQNFIQTDAAINPGNSGGALVDTQGRLVGINTAIVGSRNEGIGFAVPVNMARNVMERLITGGKVSRGYLGVSLQDLDVNLAEAFGLMDQDGVIVDDVLPDSPGAKAGILSGDVITAFNGKRISNANTLLLTIADSAPGSKVTLKLIRNGNPKEITATLGEKTVPPVTTPSAVASTSKPTAQTADGLDGVSVDNLDQSIRNQLRLPSGLQGALVTGVSQTSNAADAGLARGDVIQEINRQSVTNAEDAIKFCRQAKTKQILVKILRPGQNGPTTQWIAVDNMK